MIRDRVNNLKSVKWVVAQIYKASKLAFYNANRIRRLRLNPRRLSAEIATEFDGWPVEPRVRDAYHHYPY